MLFELQTHTCRYNSNKTMIIGTTILLATNKTKTCDGFILIFIDTVPIATGTSQNPSLIKPVSMERWHWLITGWALTLNQCLGVIVPDWNPACRTIAVNKTTFLFIHDFSSFWLCV